MPMQGKAVDTLKELGQVAGIAGIALGVVAILFRDFIQKSFFPTLSKKSAYKLLVLFLILTWSIGLAGLGAWVFLKAREQPTKVSTGCEPERKSSALLVIQWDCASDPAQRAEVVKKNLRAISYHLSMLRVAQDQILLPSIADYLQNPTQPGWRTVFAQISTVNELITSTTRKLVEYDAALINEMERQLPRFSMLLRGRTTLLNQLKEKDPPPPQDLIAWAMEYGRLVHELADELDLLEKKI